MDEQNAAATPAPDPNPVSVTPVAAEVSSSAAVPPEPVAGVGKADDTEARERWLRQRFEKEHEVTLALMRLLLAGLSSQSRRSRFWRWLIDDFRSERRLLADGRELNEESVLINRVLAWFREQTFFGSRPGSDGHVEGSGP
jgi:hypothetical protein